MTTTNPLNSNLSNAGESGGPHFPFYPEFYSDADFFFNLSPAPTKTYLKKNSELKSFESKERTELPTQRDCWALTLNCQDTVVPPHPVTEASIG